MRTSGLQSFEIVSTYKHAAVATPNEPVQRNGSYQSDNIVASPFNRTRPFGLMQIETAVKPLVEQNKRYHHLQYNQEMYLRGDAELPRAGSLWLAKDRFRLPAARRQSTADPDAVVRLHTNDLQHLPDNVKVAILDYADGEDVKIPLREHVRITKGLGEHAMELHVFPNGPPSALHKLLLNLATQGATRTHKNEFASVQAVSDDLRVFANTSMRPELISRTERRLSDGSLRVGKHTVPATADYTGEEVVNIDTRIDDRNKTVISAISLEDNVRTVLADIERPKPKCKREVDQLTA